ncbi:MAG: protein kinase [Deltaproteobacteria bacterium]|nr:protein kinase [Deltaproteobacteria bacterium]
MDPTTRASIVFARLKDLPPDGRARILQIECAHDPALRAEIEALLEASDQGLVSPARSPTPEALPITGEAPRPPAAAPEPAAAAAAAPEPAPALGPGAVVAGRYRLVRRIGSGGLSVVYLARQESPVRRDVALKLLAPGIHTEGVLARFEGERNALSRMNHPYVAQIHDAGTTELGQAFVAMEFIDGLPIDIHCRQHGLDPVARLELFLKVCRAVAHAHQKGIIHRDLKPTNILVTASDEGAPIPKVIDFGIAKSVSGSITSGVNATRLGFVVGTPGYMSPEQACAGDVDTATDVYALGVILYELMTDTLPLPPPDPANIDMQAWYTKLVTARPEPLSARMRGDRPDRPGRALLADLDTIALKALAPEVEQRYRTVSELAGDLERALAGEPITARAPSLASLIGRALRRHRAAALGVVAALAVLVVAGVVIANVTSAERAAREQATRALERARAEERHAAERVATAERTRARGAIAAAQAAVQVHNAAAARRNLDAVPRGLRAWEWHWLTHVIERSELVLRGHRAAVGALALSHDESALASLGEGGILRLWSTTDGAPLRELQTSTLGRSDKRHGLALALERGLVVATDHRSHMCAWDLVSGRSAWCREGVFGFFAESLSPRGELVVGTPVGVEVVALETGEPLELLRAPGGAAFAVWADPREADLVLAWGDDATFALDRGDLDGAGPTVRWRRQGAVDRTYPSVGLAALERWGDIAERDVVEARTGALVETLTSRSPFFGALEIDPSGAVATVELATAVSFRRDLGAPPDGELLGHRASITAAASGRSGIWLGDGAGEIRRWSRDIPPAPARVARTNDGVFAAALAPDGERVFTSGWGMVKAWSVRTGDELWSRWLGRDYLLALTTSGDETVVGDVSGVVTWLDARDGSPRVSRRVTDEAISSLATLDGVTFVGTHAGRLIAFDERAGGVLWTATTHAGALGPVAVHPGGRWLAVAGGLTALLPRRGTPWPDRRDGTVALVDPTSGATMRALPVGDVDGWLALAFSHDGARLAGGAADGTFTLWSLDRADGDEVIADRLPSLGLQVRGLVFTPDGERLFVGDEHGAVQIWSVKDLDHIATLPGVGSLIMRLAMSPESGVLVAMTERFPLATFEPWPPSPELHAAHVRWSERARLREALDALFEREGGAAAVIDAVLRDPALALQADALTRMARARGDNPNELNSWAWGQVRYPGAAGERVARARRVAEICADGWPRWEFENTRALARLRDGDLVGAIASAERSMALGVERGVADLPTEWAVIALARVGLGARDEAIAALDKAERALTRPPWDADGEARSIVDEARRAAR